MILTESQKMAVLSVIFLGMAAGLIWIGWDARGVIADRDMAQFKLNLEDKASKQRNDKFVIESQQEAITAQSTQRLDEQHAAQQKETVYVEKKVVEYRDRWRNRDCRRPDDWVRLYNESLFGHGSAVPETP